MRGSFLVAVGGVSLFLAFACGGEWDAALAQQMTEELNGGILMLNGCADSPDKDRAVAAVNNAMGSIANIGLIEGSMLKVEIETATADGAISPAEADAIEAKVKEVIASK